MISRIAQTCLNSFLHALPVRKCFGHFKTIAGYHVKRFVTQSFTGVESILSFFPLRLEQLTFPKGIELVCFRVIYATCLDFFHIYFFIFCFIIFFMKCKMYKSFPFSKTLYMYISNRFSLPLVFLNFEIPIPLPNKIKR